MTGVGVDARDGDLLARALQTTTSMRRRYG